MALLEKKSEEGGVVSRNKAKAELEQVRTLPFDLPLTLLFIILVSLLSFSYFCTQDEMFSPFLIIMVWGL